MRRTKVNNRIERQICTGMIISDDFLRKVRGIYDPDLMEIPFARRISGWCFDYYERYGRAPGEHIQDLYKSNIRKGFDEAESELIADFLEEISDEHERADRFNVDYVLDQTEERFRSLRVQRLGEDLQGMISDGELQEAEVLISEFSSRKRSVVETVNPFTSEEAIKSAFTKSVDPLFTIPGALGGMINEHLIREGLVGFMGREKIGKTWLLQELAIRAARFNNNVVFFGMGDMSTPQMIRRKMIRIAGKSDQAKYCGRQYIPVPDCLRNQDDSCNLRQRTCDVGLDIDEDRPIDPRELLECVRSGYSPCTACMGHRKHGRHFKGVPWYDLTDLGKPLSWREAIKIGSRFSRRMKDHEYRLVTYPNSTQNIHGIENQLDLWEAEDGWIPDVIVIDYADIEAPEPEDERKDTRDQQNGNWKAKRRLSQERKCLVITATQADAASYDARSLRMKNFSEDKRKYGHVTAMFSLNQTDPEKLMNILRVGSLVIREGDFHPGRHITLLQHLKSGRPLIESY